MIIILELNVCNMDVLPAGDVFHAGDIYLWVEMISLSHRLII